MLDIIMIVLIAVLSYAYFSRSKLSLPGPTGLPLIGYGLSVGDTPHKTFMRLSHTYGPIFKVQLGYQEWIILNTKEAIREAFIQNAKSTSGRAHNIVLRTVIGEKSMGYTADMDIWKSQRAFTKKALQTYGTNKMEEVIREEVGFLHTELARHSGQPCNCRWTILKALGNVCCQIAMGRRYDYHEKLYREISASVQIFNDGRDTEPARKFAQMVKVTFLRWLPGYREIYHNCIAAYARLRNEIASHIDEHKRTLVQDTTRDLTDEFLKEIAKQQHKDDMFTETELPTVLQSLFGASIDTLTNSINWCIIGISTNLEHQEKIYTEVASVLESKPYISMEDNLPFTKAFIQEIMRHCVPTPLLLPHRSTEDLVLSGYKIPKETPMFGNVWAVHRNEKLFENPDQFRPERFLDAEGKFVFCEDVMPFSVGPRRCPGEQIARLATFLFVAYIVSKFNVLPDDEGPVMSLGKGMSFFGFSPENFKARFVERKLTTSKE